jgi:hypothetical protein
MSQIPQADPATSPTGSITTTPFQIYKFGIMVDSLDMSQKCFYIVKQLNSLVDTEYVFSPTVFYQEYARSIDVNRFCMLLNKEAWGYDGIVIATNLNTANTLLQCPCPIKKFFYVWDLEWIYHPFMYQYLQNIYQSDLVLIARNNDHARVIHKCWKKPEYIMDNFDISVLKQLVQNSYVGAIQ